MQLSLKPTSLFSFRRRKLSWSAAATRHSGAPGEFPALLSTVHGLLTALLAHTFTAFPPPRPHVTGTANTRCSPTRNRSLTRKNLFNKCKLQQLSLPLRRFTQLHPNRRRRESPRHGNSTASPGSLSVNFDRSRAQDLASSETRWPPSGSGGAATSAGKQLSQQQ